jgi:Ca2+-binding RTX toxin-like protein
MAIYNWSALTNGQTIATFDPNVDLLIFDDASISAANVFVDGDSAPPDPFLSFSYGGKTVIISVDPLSATTTNVTFANGSQLLLGDNTTGTVNDDNANTLTGGSSNDHIIGLSGADSLSGGGGNDLFTMYASLETWDNDTILGGSGKDRITFNTNDSHLSGITVTFNGFDVTLGALATITGGDGSSTITMSGVEWVTGTELADTFIGTTAIPVNGRNADVNAGSDVTLVFDGAGGNDVFTGATGDGRNTVIAYYLSANAGITVNLGTGTTSNDGLGGVDTFTNIDGVFGSHFADSLTGGSNSISTSGTLLEFFEGFSGNDTIDGGNGNDRTLYDNSPGAVVVNLGNGTASDGWGGFDTLISINQVRGSAFNDTMLGGEDDDQFEGANGNDFIDGGAGFDAVRYTRATGAVFVNLATGEGRALDTVTGASVGVDFFTHIEDVRGGDFADSLVGGGDGLLESGAVFSGAEAFEGRAGNDTISGGDTVVGSGSIDIARYLNAPSAVIVNLSAAAVLGVASNRANDGYGVNGNPAGIDTLININGATGSNFNDTLVGGNNDEFFEGRKGADSIVGGLGADMLMYDDSPAAVTINLGTNVYNDGWGTVDIVSGIENVIGSVFDDSLTGDANANRLEGDSGADTLTGGLGNDTLFGGDDGENDVANYSAASGAVTVNLAAGTATGADGSDALFGIEFVFGSASGDTITGDEEANFIRGNGGNDTLNGGGQNLALAVGNIQGDFADYQSAAGAVTVSLASQGAGQVTGQGTDTLTNFESIRGSNNGDTLTGDAGNNFLRGGLGNDTLNGGGGIDWADYRNASASVTVSLATNTSSGADGVDTLSLIEGISGSDFNDTFTGSAGDDWFRGRNGNDSITGGAGFDMVTYRPAGGGVTVNLGAGTVTGAEGADTLSGIEGAEGTMFNDTLIGNNATANALYGFGGNDTLRVTQGADTLDGGADFDTIDFSAVTGIVYAGVLAVNVNLATHIADLNKSFASVDSVLVSIETVLGTAGDDVFTGGDAAHALDSLGNNITERFRGNAGNDTITGATGAGIFTYADYANNTNTQHVTASLFTGVVSDGLGGTDTLVNVDGLRGGAGNDLLLGGSLSRSGGGTFFEVLRGNGGNDTLNGGNANSGGTASSADRADYSGNTNLQAVNVNLGTGIALDGMGGTDTLIDIEHVYGGAGNDTLTGSNTQNDDLDGGAGSDTIDGSGGSDTVRFQQSTAGVIVNLSASSIKVNGITVAAGKADDGMGGTDTLINIESVRGTDFNDYIRGSDNVSTRQFLQGDAGNDTIDGGAGIDFANYASVALVLGGLNAFISNGAGTVNDKVGGTDTLINIEGLAGTHSNDTLTGSLGDQWFRGNGGNDTINGGSGNDWVLYSSDPLGVTVNLTTGTATDGWNGPGGLLALGGTDTLTLIENAEGSDYDDNITGGSGANELRGRAGNDALLGGNGNDTLNGGDGDDNLRGQVGDDILNGDAGTDTASYAGAASGITVSLNTTAQQNTGGAGLDTLTTIENLLGSSFADTLTGDDSANVIDGASDNDTLDGGLGNDTLFGGLGDDSIDGGDGVDTASYAGASAGVFVALFNATQNNASAGIDTLTNIENLIGTNFDDSLLGDGSTSNHMAGGAGNDFLAGGGGADTMVGGTGDDTYSFEDASDVIIENTGEGVDTVSVQMDITYTLGANIENGKVAGNATTNIIGNTLDNSIFEGSLALSGNNIFNGSTGIDTMSYEFANNAVTVSLALQGAAQNTVGEGSDTLIGFENLTGSDYDDTLTGGTTANALKGELGHDNLNGGLGNDTLEGGDGDDTLTGSTGDDNLVGGNGLDWAWYNGAGSAVTVNLATVIAQNTGGAGTDTLNTIENVLGSNYNDTLTGNSAANNLEGGAGNDTLDGGAGNDTMKGGGGNDLYFVNAAGDVVIEGAGGGTDSVQSSVTHSLSANVENLTLTGVGNSTGNGNALDNSLTGNSGNNTLNGGTGEDTMVGGLGNDTYVVNASGDVVTEGGGEGTDTVQAATSHTLALNVENLTLTGTGGASGNGNTLDNILTGNSGNNNLNGGTGNDTMIGGAGNDTYSVGVAGDIVTEGVGAGTDTVNTAINYTLTDNVENLTQTGSANTSGTGNTQNNKLSGNGGNNTLIGNDGADTITGGSGNDTLTGGTGIDTFDYNALTDAADSITDFTAGAGGDKIDIDTLLTVLGYNGADPLAAGYVNLLQSGADVQIQIDSDGGGDNFATMLVTLQNVTAGNITLADNFIV